jgi:MoaA/NifB/PqqE/SkfB family radical SAM enzyme
MARSKNPDLLFPEILLERADRVSNLYFNSKEGMLSTNLDRVTLFVTHRCNLICSYCNGPHMDKSMDSGKRKAMLRSDITPEQYLRHLEDWAEHSLKNIHFTGGEATMHADLPEFIRLATEKGILSTLTTNGTAPTGLYKMLVDNGLSEIRISIDAAADEEFDRIVGVKGSCAKVKRNLDALVKMRDEQQKDVYIVINACVGSFNIGTVKSTLDSLMGLKPDAIKFLVVAEQKGAVRSEASREFVNELLEYVNATGRDDELLERKIRSMFRKSSSGLSCKASQMEMKRCFIPLTERTLDGRHLYPCSIYVRYKGAPIISADVSFEEQQAALLDFVDNHDCREDSICIDNCTNCCKQYNIEVNRKVRGQKAVQAAYENGSIVIDNVTDEEVSDFLQTYEEIQQVELDGNRPFVIIKPQGMEHREHILRYLEEQGLVVREERTIEDWRELSLFLYYRHSGEKDVKFRIAKNKAHTLLDPGNSALCLVLEEGIPEAKLHRIRTQVRNWYGESLRYFEYDGERAMIRSNCIHVLDYSDMDAEKKVVDYFLG